jgi:hypothetical protein
MHDTIIPRIDNWQFCMFQFLHEQIRWTARFRHQHLKVMRVINFVAYLIVLAGAAVRFVGHENEGFKIAHFDKTDSDSSAFQRILRDGLDA